MACEANRILYQSGQNVKNGNSWQERGRTGR